MGHQPARPRAMQSSMYLVDVFANVPFRGNPAAVCVFDEWPSDDLLTAIAIETHYPVTAFAVPATQGVHLRWFTRSGREVMSLCGHGTFAAAHVLLTVEAVGNEVTFLTHAGRLKATRTGDWIGLEFPRWSSSPVAEPIPGFGGHATEVRAAGRDYLVVFASEAEVRTLAPDFEALKQLGHFGFIATAPGKDFDCVSRYFCPSFGLGEDEDLVTASAHCAIAPYWAERLGKPGIHAWQASRRGGELRCRVHNTGVRIEGQSVLFARGVLHSLVLDE